MLYASLARHQYYLFGTTLYSRITTIPLLYDSNTPLDALVTLCPRHNLVFYAINDVNTDLQLATVECSQTKSRLIFTQVLKVITSMEEKKWEIRCANKDAFQIAVETQNEILSLKRLQDPLLNLESKSQKEINARVFISLIPADPRTGSAYHMPMNRLNDVRLRQSQRSSSKVKPMS